MKITDVKVDILKVELDEPYAAGGRSVEANWHVLARITTDEGIEGFGYDVKQRADLVRAIAAATEELGQHIIGMDIMNPEAVWNHLAARGDWVGPGGFLHWAIAPLDIAVWDAAGKLIGQPIYKMLGGYRDGIPAYASDRLWYSLSLDELSESAENHAKNGFGGLKLRLGKTAPPEEQVERVLAARKGAGDGVTVMVDATESRDFTAAVELGLALQDAGVGWYEDPLPHHDLNGLSELAAMLEMPVTGGEHLYQLTQFRETFEARALDIAIIDLARAGGITPWRKIAALAEAFHMKVCGHVVPEVHAHLLSAVPNGHIVEFMPRSTPILNDMPVPENGVLKAPDGPGLGFTLKDDAVEKFGVA